MQGEALQGCTLKSDTPSGSCSAWNDILSFKAILLQSGGHRKECICTSLHSPAGLQATAGAAAGHGELAPLLHPPDKLIMPPACIHTPNLQPNTVPLLLPLLRT